jgi:hypothetical protein
MLTGRWIGSEKPLGEFSHARERRSMNRLQL